MLNYSEAAFFDGNHCAHVAARDENDRRVRLAKLSRDAVRLAERERR